MSTWIDYIIFLGAILCVCGVAVMQTVGLPQRKGREATGVWIGSLIFGSVGFVASSILAMFAGFMPFLGAPGNPTAMAVVIFSGTALFAWSGAKFGKLWAHRSLPRSRWPY